MNTSPYAAFTMFYLEKLEIFKEDQQKGCLCALLLNLCIMRKKPCEDSLTVSETKWSSLVEKQAGTGTNDHMKSPESHKNKQDEERWFVDSRSFFFFFFKTISSINIKKEKWNESHVTWMMVIRFHRHNLFGQTGNAKEKKKPWYSFF